MVRTILIAVLLSGCGGEAYYTCSDSVFIDSRFGDGPGDCAETQHATALAGKLLTDSGHWVNPEAGVPLVVRPTTGWDYEGTRVIGLAWLGKVEVDWTRLAILHELFHVQDNQNLYFPAPADSHKNWEFNGRYALANLYKYALDKTVVWRGGSPCADPLHPKLVKEALYAAGWGPTIEERAEKVANHCKK
jgi:hypothetical protein